MEKHSLEWMKTVDYTTIIQDENLDLAKRFIYTVVENGLERLKLLGLLFSIQAAPTINRTTTTRGLATLGKISAKSVSKYTEKLSELGLIKRRRIPTETGNGQTFEFFIEIDQKVQTSMKNLSVGIK